VYLHEADNYFIALFNEERIRNLPEKRISSSYCYLKKIQSNESNWWAWGHPLNLPVCRQ
jgi:hypothetical protein